MPPSPTAEAPANVEELKVLLQDDTKVKVAGLSLLSSFTHPESDILV